MITAEEARRAVQFLVDSAGEYAAAVADAERLETMLRVTKSAVLLNSQPGPVSIREAEAYASDAYRAAVDEWRAVKFEAEKLRALRHAATYKIDMWRTAEANSRAAERGFSSAR